MSRNNLNPKPKPRNHFNAMSRAQKLLLIMLIPIAGFSILPIIFVLHIGLLPTLTIMVVDGNNSSKLTIVGCFNVAGAIVYIFGIIGGSELFRTEGLGGSIFSLIIMLGAAAIGLFLYHELPNLFTFIYKSSFQRYLKNIDDQLAQISETWGSEIIKSAEDA